MSTGKWDISKLLHILKHEIVSRSRSEQFRGTPINESENNLEFPSTMYVNSASSFSCIYCNKLHAPNRCAVLTNVIVRKNILRENKRCYVCLKGGYNSNKCNKRHHVSICDQRSNRDEELASQDIGKQQITLERTNHILMISVHNNTLLQTAIAKISNLNDVNCSHKVRLLFDNCSHKSFIQTKLCERLNLQIIRTERLTVKTSASVEATIQDLNVVNFKVTSKNGINSVILEAYAVPTICAPVANQTLKLATDKHSSLRNMYLADYDLECAEKEIDILVGANHYWSFTSGRITRIENQLVALDTILGRVLSESFQPLHQIPPDSVNVLSTHVLEMSSETSFIPDDKLEKFWSVESVRSNISIKECDFNTTKFMDKIRFNGKRYTVPLPWKPNHELLPDNYTNCFKRLQTLLTGRGNSTELLENYDKKIKQQEIDGIIERIKHDKVTMSAGNVHYLPHHAVVRPDKETSKLRIVYDASSNYPSLNDCLFKGPNMTPLILDILIKFRMYKVALTSDIEQAFLNVEVNEERKRKEIVYGSCGWRIYLKKIYG